MKGIYIFEEAELKGVVTCAPLSGVEHEFTQTLALGKREPEVEVDLQADVDYDKIVTARCSKDDSYDFETGALIALMKMCGADKTEKALGEIFGSESREIIQRAFDAAQISVSKNEYEEKIRALENTRDLLTNKNNELIEENEHLKEKLVKRKKLVNSMYGLRSTEYETKMAENAELKQQVEKLEEENRRDKYVIERFNQDYTTLKEDNEKLKLDIQKLQRGYIDTDMVFCGGRCCDMQHKDLVELFKHLRQETVDSAYKEVYKTELMDWEKEYLEQLFAIYKKSKEQTKPLTKREQMWGKILGDYKIGEKISVKVDKAFINDFLSEAEDKGIVWANGGEKPTEWNRWNDWRRHDYTVFQIWNYPPHKELTWGARPVEDPIDYLPPMRWDLFKKGRIIVGIRREQYEEFKAEANRQFGVVNYHNPYDDFNYSFFMYDNRVNYITPIGKSQFRQAKTINNVKVVYWEDVK